MGASVTGSPNLRYSVFQPLDSADKRRGVVVVNFGDRDETAEVKFDGVTGGELEISAPFEADRKASLPARLTIPAQRCAVLILH